MCVSFEDTRCHGFPEGWEPVGEEFLVGDAEVWILERV